MSVNQLFNRVHLRECFPERALKYAGSVNALIAAIISERSKDFGLVLPRIDERLSWKPGMDSIAVCLFDRLSDGTGYPGSWI